jgi:hypothetical protein
VLVQPVHGCAVPQPVTPHKVHEDTMTLGGGSAQDRPTSPLSKSEVGRVARHLQCFLLQGWAHSARLLTDPGPGRAGKRGTGVPGGRS